MDIKTKKLKKLWAKKEELSQEIQELREEHQQEKESLLETIRTQDRELKLKNLILQNFVPMDEISKLERRAIWSDEVENWQLARLDLAGNQVRPRRPVSAGGLRRPETEHVRQRKQYDPNPRYKADNIINLELDPADRTTQDYEGSDMVSRVNQIINLPLGQEEEEIVVAPDSGMGNPYQQYQDDGEKSVPGTEGRESRQGRPSSGKRSKSSGKRRPSSARNRKDHE